MLQSTCKWRSSLILLQIKTISSMQSLSKHTKSISDYMMNAVMKPRRQAYFFAKTCDIRSTCATTAREILLLLEKKKNVPEQNERIKEEIWVMLDHEKLLSEYNCCILSKMTIQELLRIMLIHETKEELIRFVEEITLEMEDKYSHDLSHTTGKNKINIQALVHKHMGNGMEYLKQLHLSKKTSSRSSRSDDYFNRDDGVKKTVHDNNNMKSKYASSDYSSFYSQKSSYQDNLL